MLERVRDREETVDSGVTPIKSRAPRSADSSPQVSPVSPHSNKIREHSVKRAKSSLTYMVLKAMHLYTCMCICMYEALPFAGITYIVLPKQAMGRLPRTYV